MIKQGVEVIVFSGIAAAVLLVGFYTKEVPGSPSSGATGLDTNTLIEVAPTMAAMVEAWDAPPEVPQTAASLAFNIAETETEITLPSQLDTLAAVTTSAPILAAPSLAPQSTFVSQPREPQKSPQELERIRLSQIQPTSKPKVVPAQPTPRVETPKPAPKATPQKPRNAQPNAPTQPQATAQKAIAGRQAQTAAGAGGGKTAGTAAAPASSGISSAKSKQLEAAWLARIRSKINNRQRYPRGTDVKSATVTVRITLAVSGQLRSVAVVKSSGIKVIDDAAISAVKRSGRFPAAPKNVKNIRLKFDLPIRFMR
jgi:protein TonB